MKNEVEQKEYYIIEGLKEEVDKIAEMGKGRFDNIKVVHIPKDKYRGVPVVFFHKEINGVVEQVQLGFGTERVVNFFEDGIFWESKYCPLIKEKCLGMGCAWFTTIGVSGSCAGVESALVSGELYHKILKITANQEAILEYLEDINNDTNNIPYQARS